MSLHFKKGDEVKISTYDKVAIITEDVNGEEAKVNFGDGNYFAKIPVSQLTLITPAKHLLRRHGAFKIKKETPTETEPNETSGDETPKQVHLATLEQKVEALSLQPEDTKDTKIYFVLIRAHSGITLQSKNPEDIDTVTPPKEMTVYKITSALNGLSNCDRVDYGKKRLEIKNSIEEYYKRPLPNIHGVCNAIQIKLREEEKGIFDDSEKRTIISDTNFINKKFELYSKEYFNGKLGTYTPIECFYYDKTTRKFIQNKKISEYIIELLDLLKEEMKEEIFTIKDILDALKFYKKKNVVLIDFGCSSYNSIDMYSDDEREKVTTYLNDNNLHGGINTKRHKKRKTRKSIKKRKTRKSSKTSKTRKNYAL